MHGVRREHDAAKLALKAQVDEGKIREYREALQRCQSLRASLPESKEADVAPQWTEVLKATAAVLMLNRCAHV
jgi:hypothetical protein